MADDFDKEPQKPEPAEPAPAPEPAPAADPAPAASEPVPEAEPTAAPESAPAPQPVAAPAPQPPAPGTQPYQQPPTQPYAPQPGQPMPYGQQPAPGQPVNPYGQPAQPYYQQPVQKSGKATGALVCGVLAILFAGLPLVGIILGIIAIVMAGKAVKEAGKDGKTTGGKVCGIIGIVLSVLALILYMVLSMGVFAYVVSQSETIDRAPVSSSSTNDSSVTLTEEEQKAQTVVETELDKIKSKDAAFMQKLAADLDEEFSTSSGYSLTELGVEPMAFAEWLVADFDYKLDGVYAFSDGTGSAYADVTLRDGYAFLSAFLNDATEFANSGEEMDEATAKARLGEIFNAAMEKTADMTDQYISLELKKTRDTWAVDQDSWDEQVSYLFGI